MENFKKEAKKIMDDIFAKIDVLEAKKNDAKADAKTEYEEQLANLKSKKAELQYKYEELTEASKEKWDEAKEAFSSASDSFKEGLSKIGSLISD